MQELASVEDRTFLRKQLKDKFSLLGIKNALWDFDGTLIDTRRLFDHAIEDACGMLVFGQDWPGRDFASGRRLDQVVEMRKKMVQPAIFGLRKEMFVNPVITQYGIYLMAKRLGIDENDLRFSRAIDRVRQITQSPAAVFPQAREMVDLVNQTGVDSYLMTHADMEWTQTKLSGAGLVGRFKSVYCFAVDESKEDQWSESFQNLGIKPEESLAIGDNYQADIEPLVDKIALAVWITAEKNQDKEKIIKIEEVGQVAKAIIDFRVYKENF